MHDILHKVGAKSSSPQEAFLALTQLEGLGAWWTNDVKLDDAAGKLIRFTFGETGFFVMKVLEQVPGKRVEWQVMNGPDDWIGSRISFDISQADDYTLVMFRHSGWSEPSESMHHCSTKWAMFLMSLKSLLETGQGSPHPKDVSIDNWN